MGKSRAWALICHNSVGVKFKTAATVLFCLALTGCGAKNISSVLKGCVLPTDQSGTLSGKWKSTAVPIAFHQGDFTADEIAAIVRAANTWNDFYGQSLSISAIDYGSAANPRISTAPRPASGAVCTGSITNANGGFTGQVVLYKNTSWPFASQPTVIALTTYCRAAGTPLPYFFTAIIDFNYQNFWAAGKRIPDLQSIIAHEFGHLMGLNHSCELAGRTGVPTCNAAGVSQDYTTALMFPSFSFTAAGAGQIKHDLQINDEGRANCLYMNF